MACKVMCFLVMSVVEGLKLETMLCGAGPDAPNLPLEEWGEGRQDSICRTL